MSDIKDKLNRKQQRMKERFESEAKDTYETIAAKWLDYFVTCDNPEAEEVEQKRIQFNAQWRVYCKKMQLTLPAYDMFDNYSKGIVKEYNEQKKPVDAAAS